MRRLNWFIRRHFVRSWYLLVKFGAGRHRFACFMPLPFWCDAILLMIYLYLIQNYFLVLNLRLICIQSRENDVSLVCDSFSFFYILFLSLNWVLMNVSGNTKMYEWDELYDLQLVKEVISHGLTQRFYEYIKRYGLYHTRLNIQSFSSKYEILILTPITTKYIRLKTINQGQPRTNPCLSSKLTQDKHRHD